MFWFQYSEFHIIQNRRYEPINCFPTSLHPSGRNGHLSNIETEISQTKCRFWMYLKMLSFDGMVLCSNCQKMPVNWEPKNSGLTGIKPQNFCNSLGNRTNLTQEFTITQRICLPTNWYLVLKWFWFFRCVLISIFRISHYSKLTLRANELLPDKNLKILD